MLITKTVLVKWHPRNKEHYESKGYLFTKIGDEFEVKVEDLSKHSSVRVDCNCDCFDCQEPLLKVKWSNYLVSLKEDGKYYCYKCARKLYVGETIRKTMLKNSISFEQWCINNNRQDVLDRWDYELNSFKPSEVSYSTQKKFYFKCPRRIHKSELKKIAVFTSGHPGHMSCKQCNSFEQWCIDNNKQDILDRWDYDLNKDKPSDISYSAGGKRYFKCPKGIHKSELKHMDSFVHGELGAMNCKSCNSFAQWSIDNIDKNFLDKYWDWDKNNELGIDPWVISYASKKKVYIKCQEKEYHKSYAITCASFSVQGSRCPYCSNKNGVVHPLDSLGKLLEDKGLLHLWSKKNKKSPYEYAPKSHQEVWWKCPEGHKNYKRIIINSNNYNFRCPECQYSEGEEAIGNCLTEKGFIKISQDEFKQLINNNKYNINYFIPQMKFDGLMGTGGGLLSYDFYIPKYNLLIEYQGNYHDGTIPYQTKKQFEKQQEHDRRKNEYTKINNINLLEIWYWDFNKIEEILIKKLNL